MKAVVVDSVNNINVEDVELSAPKQQEIKVKVMAAGLCHSDLSILDGTVSCPLPMILGHEGSGVVTEVGPGVTRFNVGDHVVFTCQPVCGQCPNCLKGQYNTCTAQPLEEILSGTQLDGSVRNTRANGEPLPSMLTVGCMAEETVVHEYFAVKVGDDHPFDHACIVGCGVITGAGGAIYGANIRVGDSVVITGCGGVGLSAVQGARLAGAKNIIAVDIADNKLKMALELGATHTVNGGSCNAVEEVLNITKQGADAVLECSGVSESTGQAFEMLRLGGTLVQIGVPAFEKTLPISSAALTLTGKTVKAGKYGDNNPRLDIPNYLDFSQQGRINLEKMITKTYRIDQVQEAFEDMKNSVIAKGVILFE